MPDQADNLRQLIDTASPLARAAMAGPPLVVLTGGKAGAGTTTVAVNLAAALADAGLRVVLVDAARQNADIARAAGIDVTDADLETVRKLSGTVPILPVGASLATKHVAKWGLSPSLRQFPDSFLTSDGVIDNKRPSAATLQPGPAGTLLLAGGPPAQGRPSDSRRAQHRLLAELQMLPADTDLVLVDAGSGVTPGTRRLWRRARLVLVVTTADDVAVMDSYATIKLAAADDLAAGIRVLVNQCDAPARAGEVHHRLSAACQRFLDRAVPAVPHLPRCYPAEDQAHHAGPPRVWETPNSPFGHAVLWLGRAVADVLARPLAA